MLPDLENRLIDVEGRAVLVSYRFDRGEGLRIPFLSALSMMQLKDGERSSYPDIVDQLTQVGASVLKDSKQLFRRMIFNILVSNVDDHLRNHGFLMKPKGGWTLSPAYDLNPVPQDMKDRVLSTAISPDDAACSIPLAIEQAEYFNLTADEANVIVREVGMAVSEWQKVAASCGQTARQIARMDSAFEHGDLKLATTPPAILISP